MASLSKARRIKMAAKRLLETGKAGVFSKIRSFSKTGSINNIHSSQAARSLKAGRIRNFRKICNRCRINISRKRTCMQPLSNRCNSLCSSLGGSQRSNRCSNLCSNRLRSRHPSSRRCLKTNTPSIRIQGIKGSLICRMRIKTRNSHIMRRSTRQRSHMGQDILKVRIWPQAKMHIFPHSLNRMRFNWVSRRRRSKCLPGKPPNRRCSRFPISR